MKYIISGGPCSGKTSLIDLFRKKGYSIEEEVARKVLEKRTTESYEKIQLKIFEEQLKVEETETAFFDRSLVDGLAYCKIYLDQIPEKIKNFDYKNRYDFIFIPDMLSFEQDGLRIESEEGEAKAVHSEIILQYKEHGYTPISIPVMSIERRLDLILNYIK